MILWVLEVLACWVKWPGGWPLAPGPKPSRILTSLGPQLDSHTSLCPRHPERYSLRVLSEVARSLVTGRWLVAWCAAV